jgi:NTE family protein
MTTALVLSGGASLGAIQVGMYEALADAGIVPDVLLGTSVGALNAAYLAGHPGPEGAHGLAQIWLDLRATDVFPVMPIQGLRGFLGRSNHLLSPEPLRELIRTYLVFDRLEDAPVPLYVVATELITGEEAAFREGDAIEAILASAAIPAVFPPVKIGDHYYMDGGVADNTPISQAVRLGVDVIYVLPTGHTCGKVPPPRGALGMVLHAITLLIGQQLVRDTDRYRDTHDIRVVPPLCPMSVFPADFRHTRRLLERGRASTAEWLAAGQPEASLEALGRHLH